MSKRLVMGNEAMAHAALEAGVNVVAGYPGTPSSEIIECVARLHASGSAKGVHVEWSANEKAALELLGGASLAGARCLYTCKQMGLNVASDPLMCLAYVGVRGGLVLVVADDPGPISSQTEQDTRRFAAFAKVPVLDPSTPEQAFAMVKAAFELSEKHATPVIVRPTTRIDHASAFFDLADSTCARPLPAEGFERDPGRWVIFPRLATAAHARINERLPQIAGEFSTYASLREGALGAFNPVYVGGASQAGASQGGGLQSDRPRGGGPQLVAGARADDVDCACAHAGDAPQTSTSLADRRGSSDGVRRGIVAGGVTAAYALEALTMLERCAAERGACVPPYRFMQVGTPFPFPAQAVRSFVEGLDEVLVLEELDYVLEDELARLAGRLHLTLDVRGRLTGDARDHGENDVDDVMRCIAAFLETEMAELTCAPFDFARDAHGSLPPRPPVLCAGCPHRGSFYAIKQALGKTPAVLCGDIGCYTLGNAQPLDALDTCLCMGGGITQAQGIAVADPGKKAIAYVGDSTFFASGMAGVANSAYNGHDITVVVLDNATTAMTGAQPHPGTGVTLMGPVRPPLSIEAVLRACNFSCVVHADPLDLDAAVAAAKEAIDFPGPAAVLFESPCIQLVRPKPPVSISQGACTGCKRCITSIGCPAIGFDVGVHGPASKERGQAFIDATLCNGCGLCVSVCPFQAIQKTGGADCGGRPTRAGLADRPDSPPSSSRAGSCPPDGAGGARL